MSDLKAPASTSSPSWMSIARLTFPSRLELKSLAGSSNEAPLANVNFTTDLYDSPVQMMPSCDQTGVPGLVFFTHLTSSTTSGSASLTSLRILLKVSPRQSPSSAIRLSMSSDADLSMVSSFCAQAGSERRYLNPGRTELPPRTKYEGLRAERRVRVARERCAEALRRRSWGR